MSSQKTGRRSGTKFKKLDSQKKYKIKIKIRVHDKWAKWQLYDLHYSQKKKQ